MHQQQIDSVDLDSLQRIAGDLVGKLPNFAVIALTGTLGAGKTRLVQAIASELMIDASSVTSPTYTLMQTHHGFRQDDQRRQAVELCHVDAYRIADEDEWFDAGVQEQIDAPVRAGDHLGDDSTCNWICVEWADRFAELIPDDAIWINIALDASELRRITLRGICL